jgi:acyl-CoA synthetase (AMP-forming)/AMP-acid ligase II
VSASTSLVDNLRASAQRHAARCAVRDGSLAVTYGSLWQQSMAVARELTQRGLKRGGRVAIVLANGSEFIAGYYGTQLAGGVVVLLNAAAKSRDFAAWMSDCEPAFVLCDRDDAEVAAAVAQMGQAPVVIHAARDPERAFACEPGGAPFTEPSLCSQDAACILYTSGTTGRPKGVVLSHANLVANTASIVEYLRLTHEDSIVTILPFYYSYGSSVLHTHLLAGGCLILEKNFLYPHSVVETLSASRATGFAGVPSTYALLLSRVKLADHDLSAVRYLTQAGGAMTPALTQRLRAALPRAELFVMYGQTEATARLTYLPPKMLDVKLGSVGIGVPGVTLEIRGDDGRVLPSGVTGEIWARGPNIMLGYWRNPAASAEVLHDGWLKTGDMGRLDDDGYLFIVGRRSDMLKVGAHRIHPQDIEECIAELPAVQEAAVVGVDDELLGQTIKAFVVPNAGAAVTPMQVQAHCRARLANYKVPKSVEIVTILPRTASGKIRRAELSERIKS